jgi:hypothetical protein
MRPVCASLVAVALLIALSPGLSQAEEGMWPPGQLPEVSRQLKELGLEVDPGSLSNLMGHPMNAVISLGFCTASFVSPEGLVVTNHHCAYGAIQYNSREDRNLLEDGFIAKDRSEELFAGPGSRILVTVAVSDVTGEVLEGLPQGQSGRERYQAIEDRRKELVAACEKDEGHRCRVAAFHGGLEYHLVKQLEIRDVRLVYAPPGPVGNYGGDIDNWMWPRHTGDFSFHRAYVDKDGKPADHDDANVPFRPAHSLRVSTNGLKEGDFVMAVGYPGRTNRYRLAAEIENTIQWYYPTRKQAFLAWLEVINEKTAGDPDATIKYASWVARLNNSSKNYQGMLDGFAKSDLVERRRQQQKDLQAWIQDDPGREARYLSALKDLESLVAEQQSVRERSMFYEFFAHRSSLLGAATTLYRLSREKEKPDMEREPGYQERDLTRIRERLTRIDRTFTTAVDRALWRHFILQYAAIPMDQHVAAFDEWFGIAGNKVDEGKLDQRLGSMYDGTGLGDQDTRLAWMEKSAAEFKKSEDPFLQLAVHLYDADLALEEEDKDLTGRFQETRARFMEAWIAYLDSQGQAVYPDANGTLRVTFGKVAGLSPRDGVLYTPFTTLEGILQKDTGEDPFDAPEKLLQAMREKRHGRYYDDAVGSVPVNFLGTLDSTGGNSGSATLNARAELVGLLFDGNYESIIADWDFIDEITRSIMVDMRYVLWVMETIGGADHLFREMGIQPANP